MEGTSLNNNYMSYNVDTANIKPMNIPEHSKSTKIGKFFYSIVSDVQFKFGITPIYTSIVLYFIVFWATFNELCENKAVFIDDKYWVRIAANKLVKDLHNIICLRNMKKILQELVNLEFLEVYKPPKVGSAQTAYCYRPTRKCINYLDSTGELKNVLFDASSYYKYKQQDKTNK